jgi:hypothetical protein
MIAVLPWAARTGSALAASGVVVPTARDAGSNAPQDLLKVS